MGLLAFEKSTPQLAFENLYDFIMEFGREKSGTKYIHNVQLKILMPTNRIIKTAWRKFNAEYADVEWRWYLTGNRDPREVERYAKIWSTIKDDSGYVNSNYGQYWNQNDQLNKMIAELVRNRESRRAVLVHYNIDMVDDYTKDTPCNLVLNFYIENDYLEMVVFARSIDLVYGFCNDQYCFSMLQEFIAKMITINSRIKTNVGHVHYCITDLHIYKKHWDMKSKFKSKTK